MSWFEMTSDYDDPESQARARPEPITEILKIDMEIPSLIVKGDSWSGMGSCLNVYSCGELGLSPLSFVGNIFCLHQQDDSVRQEKFARLEKASNLWIRILGRFLDFSTISLTSTFRLSFCHRTNRFMFKRLPWVLMPICALVQVGILLKMMLDTYMVSWILANNSADIIAYFNWINNLCLIGCASVPLYWNWISRDLVDRYLESLQTNPVILKINSSLHPSRHFWTECWLQICVCLIAYAALNYAFSFLGADFLDFATAYRTSGETIEMILGPMEEGYLFEFLKYYFIVATFAQGFAIARTDLSSFLFQGTAYCMTEDFMALLENASRSEDSKDSITAEELDTYYHEFKRLERQRDDQICSTNLAMITAVFGFYPVHSVDVFSSANNTDIHLRLTMAIIFMELYYFLKKGMDTQIQFHRLKKLLGSSKLLRKLPVEQIRSILYDLDNGRLGVKCWFFFTFTTDFVGEVLQLLFTMIMINLSEVK